MSSVATSLLSIGILISPKLWISMKYL